MRRLRSYVISDIYDTPNYYAKFIIRSQQDDALMRAVVRAADKWVNGDLGRVDLRDAVIHATDDFNNARKK